jgi:hypothetical protein
MTRIIDSANDPDGMQRIVREALEEIEQQQPSDGRMRPPWLEFPTYERFCLGWRMGPGEDYILGFDAFFSALSEEESSAYKKEFPEPSGWSGYYAEVLKAPRTEP